MIRVRFRRNIYQFASEIAHALRHRVKYRSDGGRFARGLVQHSPDFPVVFQHLMRMNTFDGTVVSIEATLNRRKDPKAENRWVMFIDFVLRQEIANMAAEDVPASINPTEVAQQMIDEALVVGQQIPGDKGKRIKACLELADDIGYPALLDLWYYRPVAVRAFVKASEADQKEMVQKGSGYLLKGDLPGNWQYRPNWRKYPFKRLILRSYEGMSDERMKISLGAMDEEITESLRAINQVGPTLAGSETALSKTFLAFREHIWKMQKDDRNHLYYQWEHNTVDRRGIWAKLLGCSRSAVGFVREIDGGRASRYGMRRKVATLCRPDTAGPLATRAAPVLGNNRWLTV